MTCEGRLRLPIGASSRLAQHFVSFMMACPPRPGFQWDLGYACIHLGPLTVGNPVYAWDLNWGECPRKRGGTGPGEGGAGKGRVPGTAGALGAERHKSRVDSAVGSVNWSGIGGRGD